MNNIYYIHGSESSVDLDVLVVVNPLEHLSPNELHEICEEFRRELAKVQNRDDINVNLISVKYGRVVWCFKGTVDEVNNSLLFTYPLHKQPYNLLVKERLPRDFELKALRAVRIILSLLSRTTYRYQIKDALKGDIYHKLEVLDNIDLSTITDIGDKKLDFQDYLKKVAFQIGQVLGLYQNKELYTKEQISEEYPELSQFIQRDTNSNLAHLEYFKGLLLTQLRKRKWKRLYE